MKVTDEMVAAYAEAWEAKRKEIGRGIAEPGTKTRAGLEAALAACDDPEVAWDKGYVAHAIGITDAAGDPNPYREER